MQLGCAAWGFSTVRSCQPAPRDGVGTHGGQRAWDWSCVREQFLPCLGFLWQGRLWGAQAAPGAAPSALLRTEGGRGAVLVLGKELTGGQARVWGWHHARGPPPPSPVWGSSAGLRGRMGPCSCGSQPGFPTHSAFDFYGVIPCGKSAHTGWGKVS